jgi:pimeloyl-ACP methyl ester carboxylesterase
VIVVLIVAMTCAIVATRSAQAVAASGLQFAPCQTQADFSCASLSVPLDRSGAAPGALSLSVQRLQAGSAPSKSAVVMLAGGPGQAALPLAGQIAKTLAPALTTRDFLAFDQRGTGSSGPLGCPALEGSVDVRSLGEAFERCALQIGASRGSYTTQESVADIEALRQAGGYQKLVLFGVSYGTKVALEYAERYPQNVEALVLDSVVPTERDDPFSLATFKAMKPAFEELCAGGACRGITSDPLGDIARLRTRMHQHALRGSVYDGSGHRHTAIMSDVDLLDLIEAGDLNPALRALLPASVQSALRGDPDPLLRLDLLSEGLIPNLPGTPTSSSDGIDEALFVDTTCEEALFPWQRGATPGAKLAEALAALHAQPASAFYPFSASVEWQGNVLLGCAQWPNVAPAPPAPGPLPQVPTLILSGAQDLRTPTSGAEAVAARIPGAELIVVPYTGHSVLGTDFSGCAQKALAGFFQTGTALPCSATPDPFSPTPITPTKLAYVKAIAGVHGKSGSTLAVVLDTILDLERQVVGATFEAEQELPSGSSFGGLRGGYARLTSTALRLDRLSFVRGVQITGSFPLKHGHLSSTEIQVEGSQAAHGFVRIGGTPRISGELDGRRFSVNLSKVKLARAAGTPTAAGWRLTSRWPVPALARVR